MEYLGQAATVFGLGLLVFAWLMIANRRIANKLFDKNIHGFIAVRARFYHAVAGIVWFTTTTLGSFAYLIFALVPGHDGKAYMSLVIIGVVFILVVPLLIMHGVNLAEKRRR